MMKTKSTKRALLSSVLALVLCVSMLIGSTFAWFTDNVTSGNNIIKSGNLDIVLEYSTDGDIWNTVDATTKVFNDEALWEPGHREVVMFRVRNAGTLHLKYELLTTVIEEKGSVNVYGDEFKLSDHLTLEALAYAKEGLGFEEMVENFFASRNPWFKMDKFEFGQNMKVANAVQEMAPGYEHYYFVAITMPETVGNEANYATGNDAPYINFAINLVATQYTAEKDSFDNQYDADAEYPAYINTQKELDAAIASGEKTIQLGIGTFVIPQTPADGYEFIGVSPEATKIVPATEGGRILTGTLNDLTIKNASLEGGSGDVLRWAYGTEGKTVTFENCNLIAKGYTVHFDVLKSNLVFKDCKLTGWMSYGKNGAASFEGCEFFADGIYGILRAYSDTTLTDCEFDFAAVNATDKYQDGIDATEGVTITAVNCTNVNGSMSDLFEAADIDGTDGKVVLQ